MSDNRKSISTEQIKQKFRLLKEKLPKKPTSVDTLYALPNKLREEVLNSKYSQSSIQKLSDHIGYYLGIIRSVEVTFMEENDWLNPDISGLYRATGGLNRRILLIKKHKYELKHILAILAHESIHNYLYEHNVREQDEQENEILTDLAAVYLGLGHLLIDAYKPITWETTTFNIIIAREYTVHSATIGYVKPGTIRRAIILASEIRCWNPLDVATKIPSLQEKILIGLSLIPYAIKYFQAEGEKRRKLSLQKEVDEIMSKSCPFCKKDTGGKETCPHCHRVIIEKFAQTLNKSETSNKESQYRKTSGWLNKPFKITKGWVIGGLILLAIVYLGIESDDTSQATQQLGQEVVQPSPTPIDYRELINNDNILIKINEARLANGSAQLKMSEGLKDYANARANEINLASNLTHDTKLRVKDYDNQHSEYGEILFSGAQTASQAVNGWLNSPTHRDLILRKDYETIGVTTLQNNYKLGSIVVAEFGKIYVPPPRQRIIQFPKLEFRRRITCNTTTDYFTGDIRTTCY